MRETDECIDIIHNIRAVNEGQSVMAGDSSNGARSAGGLMVFVFVVQLPEATGQYVAGIISHLLTVIDWSFDSTFRFWS
jgi:hypothetical protein